MCFGELYFGATKSTARKWRVPFSDHLMDCEAGANSRLILAAPDMLEALERIQAAGYVHDFHPACNSDADADMLRDAIRKAKGE